MIDWLLRHSAATLVAMKKITIRIDDDQHAQIVAAAGEDRRSLNSEIQWLLEQGLETREKESKT